MPTTLTSNGGSKVYASVTRDSRDGTIYLKVVNAAADPQPLHVSLNGIGEVSHAGTDDFCENCGKWIAGFNRVR